MTRAASKLCAPDSLSARVGERSHKVVVFTNGVFDLLHAGHRYCLEAAGELGDELVVAINSDDSVRRLGKGPGRPVQPEGERALAVASLECVDHVCVFDDDTPARLVEALVPDVLVKGADYAVESVVGRDVVEAAGGRVVLVPLLAGHSTTVILEGRQRRHPETGPRREG